MSSPSPQSLQTLVFFNFCTIDILSWIILCGGGCPVHFRRFCSIPGLYPGAPSSYANPKCFQILSGVPWGQKCPYLRTTI